MYHGAPTHDFILCPATPCLPVCSPAFAKYADTLFAALGDRVKTWITFNEP